MITKTEPTYTVTVWIAGDYREADRSLRRQCFEDGLCVTLTPTRFIYTAGAEEGVQVGLVNYPRFPKRPEDLWERARVVALTLMDDLCQNSVLLVAPDRTEWLSRRPEDKPQ